MRGAGPYHRELKVAVEQAQERPRKGGRQAGGALVEQVVPRLEVLPQSAVQLLRHKAGSATLHASSDTCHPFEAQLSSLGWAGCRAVMRRSHQRLSSWPCPLRMPAQRESGLESCLAQGLQLHEDRAELPSIVRLLCAAVMAALDPCLALILLTITPTHRKLTMHGHSAQFLRFACSNAKLQMSHLWAPDDGHDAHGDQHREQTLDNVLNRGLRRPRPSLLGTFTSLYTLLHCKRVPLGGNPAAMTQR